MLKPGKPPIVHHINRSSAPQCLLKGPSFDHLRLLVVPWGRVTKPVFRYMQQTCPNLRCHSREWLTLTLILTSFPFSDATLTVYMKMPRTSHRLTFTVQLMPLDCHIRRYITAVLVLLVDYLYIYIVIKWVSVCYRLTRLPYDLNTHMINIMNQHDPESSLVHNSFASTVRGHSIKDVCKNTVKINPPSPCPHWVIPPPQTLPNIDRFSTLSPADSAVIL